MNLRQLEEWMAVLVQHPEDSAAGARTPLAQTYISPRRIEAGEVVVPNDRMTAYERLDVYNYGYFSRLKEVLESDFPGVMHAMGEEDWLQLALDYVTAHPSEHQNLNVFNRKLPAFLARSSLPHRAFLRDLATLEVMMTEAFDAPGFEPVDMDSVLHLTPEQWAGATFETNPSLCLLETDFAVNRYLQAVFDEHHPAILAVEVPEPQTTHLAIYRKDYQVWRLALPGPMFAILTALSNGAPLAEAIATGGDQEADFQRWFREWSGDGLFTAVRH